MRPLILIGGGGHCKSVIEAAESAGYSILGVLDMPEEVGKEILSTKVIGTDDDIPSYVDKIQIRDHRRRYRCHAPSFCECRSNNWK